jgi:GNAT superfamily N-acetyltransferase
MESRGRADPEAIETYDRIVVRTLTSQDLAAMVRIDGRITGRNRSDYLRIKLEEALRDTRIVVSLGAEIDRTLVGFLTGRLYFGEFGLPEPVALLETIGVDPSFRGEGVGAALLDQLTVNLRGLGIERVQTQVDWDQMDLLRFLAARGFKPAQRLCLEIAV